MKKTASQVAGDVLEKKSMKVPGPLDPEEQARSVIGQGQTMQSRGRILRNIGYTGALGLGAGALIAPRSFYPNKRGLLRLLLGGGAVLSGLGGMLGEQSMRSGKGYERAALESLGKPVDPQAMEGLHYSPAAYREASRFFSRIKGATIQAAAKAALKRLGVKDIDAETSMHGTSTK